MDIVSLVNYISRILPGNRLNTTINYIFDYNHENLTIIYESKFSARILINQSHFWQKKVIHKRYIVINCWADVAL